MADLSSGSAFFTNLDDVELSSDEEDVAEQSRSAAHEAAPPPQPTASARSAALPSADEVLGAQQSKPEFLVSKIEVEKAAAFDLRPPPEEPQPWLRKKMPAAHGEESQAPTLQQQKQHHQNTGVAVEILAAATAMSQTYKNAAFDERPLPKRSQPSRPAPAAATSNGNEGDEDDDTAPVRKKRGDPAKSFNTKEKRKRDMGQASREKSYVEEEKRLLRAQASRKSGYGFD